MGKKVTFAWDDEEESGLSSEVLHQNLLDEAASLQSVLVEADKQHQELEITRLEEIPQTISNINLSNQDLKKAEKTATEYDLKPSDHVVILCHAFYKEASDNIGCKAEEVDAIYSWYLKQTEKLLVENPDTLKLNVPHLGKFQISMKCVLGTLYKRILYAEGMIEKLSEKNFKDSLSKKNALSRVINPTLLVYHSGIKKYDLLATFPEFDNKVMKKAYSLFIAIGTKIPKLYEHIPRIR
jgi:hypothetical protein